MARKYFHFTSQEKLPAQISLLGIPLSLCTQKQLLENINQAIQSQKSITILSGNIYAYNLAYEQTWLREFFNRADYVRLDGAGVGLGARLLGYTPPARMTWGDFGWDLAAFAQQKGYRLFLLGAKPGVAERAAQKLRERFPSLQVAGIQHGYFDKSPGSAENEAVLQAINTARVDILIVGFGMPVQERWLSEQSGRIQAHVIMTGGAVFDYLSGELRRGPRLLTENGFEWLARLLIEPRRLWKRYLLGNPLFLWRVLWQRFMG